MFTGIITACESVSDIHDNQGNTIITVPIPEQWKTEEIQEAIQIGESITINGVCSTVIKKTPTTFDVEYMPETLRLTTMSTVQVGQKLNLERSMKLNDLLSGHLVYGHVDGMGTVQSIQDDGGESTILTITHSPQYSKYIISKGSITINGISLTVINPSADTFSVALIPHTWKNTNLHELTIGSRVNLEYDVIAKYIEKLTLKA